jgi:hypothetical protein
MAGVKKTKTKAELAALRERAKQEATSMGMIGKVKSDYVRNRLAPYRR